VGTLMPQGLELTSTRSLDQSELRADKNKEELLCNPPAHKG
jgi:hypothetical protein